MSKHIATVQAIYQAFGARNIPAILELLDAGVRWQDWSDNTAQKGGAPIVAARHGPDEVMGFFKVSAGLQIHEFKVLDLFGNDRQVAAEIGFDFTVPATGRRCRDEKIHLWTFGANGKVLRFRDYQDTAKTLWAFGKEAPL